MKLPSKCDGCGACCCSWDPRWIEVTEEDAVKIPPRYLREGDVTTYAMRMVNRRCIALTSKNRCRIYKDRPTICREVERGDSTCIFCTFGDLG